MTCFFRDHILFGLRAEFAAGFFGRCSSKPIARYGDSEGRRREGQVPPHGACHNLFVPRAARSEPPSRFFSSFPPRSRALGPRVSLNFVYGQKRNQFSEVDREFSILDLWCRWGTADRLVRTLRLENILTETGSRSERSRAIADRLHAPRFVLGCPTDGRFSLSGGR
jgi:hypothetical protein